MGPCEGVQGNDNSKEKLGLEEEFLPLSASLALDHCIQSCF